MIDSVCLIGNPNCGKTSLFNLLTGTFQKTGNWSGVTIEKKEGYLRNNKSIKIVDLPGLYSLNADTIDEKKVLEYLKTNNPSVIINVVDGTNLERNLYLTAELVTLGIPMIIAVNFYDDMLSNKIILNKKKLKTLFGTEVVEISAKKGINVDLLIGSLYTANKPNKSVFSASKLSLEEKQFLIANKIKEVIVRKQTRLERCTQILDDFFTHKFWGVLFFVFIIFTLYFASFKLGGFFSDKIAFFFESFAITTTEAMTNAGISPWAISLFVTTFFKGVGSVLSFIPQILILFLFMTVIEESGYAMRITFILDRIFRGFGLGGKSVVPIVLSCGCAVTGVMATRTIDDEYERRMTILLAPFMPCGAKMVVFAWFSYKFFGGNALVSTSMYFLGVFCVGFFGFLLNKFNVLRRGEKVFVVEMPTLRLPSIKNIIRVLWEKVKDFVYKSGTVIFAVSVVLWILKNFGINGYTNVVEDSFLYLIGNTLKYIFYPLGFFNWQTAVSVVTGIFAKEAVVETFSMVSANYTELFSNNFAIYSFMAFVLLSPPCAATISTMKNELKNKKSFYFSLLFQFLSAYAVSFVINAIGKLFSLSFGLIFSSIIGIILVTIAIIVIIRRVVCRQENCHLCKRGTLCQKSSKHNMTI